MTALIILIIAICMAILIATYRNDPAKIRQTLTVCAWCPDGNVKTKIAIARGYHVSHGICPDCRRRVLAETNRITERITEKS
jgi:hypothetical protein